MAQFRVVLDDVELDDSQRQQLDRALQKTTLEFLADIDTGGDTIAYYSPRLIRPPLAGIWIRRLRDPGLIERINEEAGLRESVKQLNEEIQQGVEF